MTDTPPVLYRRFALAVFIGAGAVAVGSIAVDWWAVSAFHLIGGWSDLDASRRLAAGLAIPLSILGTLLVPLGAAMAVVEWRGTLARPAEREQAAAPDLGKMLEAVGRLRGAALVMVVGALLLGGAAWVASSAAKAPPQPNNPRGTSSRSAAMATTSHDVARDVIQIGTNSDRFA
jgi:hypothetical protein